MNPRQRLSWKSKVFGDTQTNFYAWIASGLITMAASVWFVILAFRAGAARSPICLMLLAIYLIAVGHFGIALQNYHSRLARKLDEIQKDDATSNQTMPFRQAQGQGSPRDSQPLIKTASSDCWTAVVS